MKNKKALGQHWLKNRQILEEIAELASTGVEFDSEEIGQRFAKIDAHGNFEKAGAELCVEIGPGLGYLTTSLLRRFERVIAVEYDADLARKLPGSFPGKNLTVTEKDILDFNFDTIKEPYVVAGNIPYYITSPIIEKVLTSAKLPERVVLLMQKEVAERIVSPKETVLSLFVKNRARVWAGIKVPATEFTPSPKVDSQVVIFEPFKEPLVSDEVFRLIRLGFASPRKKLVHNLATLDPEENLRRILTEMEVSPDARAGDLRLEDWDILYKVLRWF